MKKLISYCGLDCEKCDARMATLNNDNSLREKVAKLWSKMNGVEITAEMINCEGCRENGVKLLFAIISVRYVNVRSARRMKPAEVVRTLKTARLSVWL